MANKRNARRARNRNAARSNTGKSHALMSNVPRRQGRRTVNKGGLLSQIPIIGPILEQTLHGFLGQLLGAKGAAAPTAFAGRSFAKQMNRSTQMGQEQVVTIVVPSGTPAGTILWQSLVAGPELGVRLKQNTALWARTMFNVLGCWVESANATSTSGSYIIAHDPDPVTDYTNGAELAQRLMALPQASKANAWASAGVRADVTGALLFNRFNSANIDDAEIRQYADGQLILATATDYVSEAVYTLNIGWDTTFEQPNTNVELLPTETFILAAGGFEYTKDGPDLTFSQEVWVAGLVPAVGVYPVISGALTLTFFNDEGDNPSFNVASIEVTADGTIIKTIGTLAGTETPTVEQTPTVYYLPNPMFSSDGYLRVGYAKVSPTILTPRNRKKFSEWYMESLERLRQHRIRKIVEKEQDLREAKAVTDLSDSDLVARHLQTLSLVNLA